MKSKLLATIATLVLVTAGACASSGSAGQSMQKITATPIATEQGSATPQGGMMPDATMTKPETMKSDGATMAGSRPPTDHESIKPEDRYVSYSSEALAGALQHGRAVLFFRADWCPTCRSADAAFKANQDEIPGDVTILAVNYDGESALKQKYNITYQHTFVQVDSSGKQLSRWSGGDVRELMSNLQ